MAKIKVKLRPSGIENRCGTIYYYVSHKRVVRLVGTDIRMQPCEWDEESQRIISGNTDSCRLQNRIESDKALLNKIVRELETSSREFSADDIVSRFRSPERHICVISFFQEQIRFLTECNRLGTAMNYRRAMNTLASFLGGRRLCFPEVTSRFIERYGEYLMQRGMVRNSLSFHMRILRALYNKAVRCGYAEQSYPFRDVYTGIDRTRKRAVDKNIILRLAELDLSHSAPLALARDLFLFSFYTRGMSFVDMAFLKRGNIVEGKIVYSRRKTRQRLYVCIEPCIRKIIDSYADERRPYIFPLLKSEDAAAAYSQYLVSMAYYNRLLKRLSAMLGLQQGLSFYAARHSWATLARDCNVPLSVISAGMGHTSERTTRIYLTSLLESSLIDNANREILSAFDNMYSL